MGCVVLTPPSRPAGKILLELRRGAVDVPAMTLAAPILPGKEEEWRRFVQEVTEEFPDNYEEFRRRLGFSNESVWLVRMDDVETAMAYLEAEDPARVLVALIDPKRPFDTWLKGRLSELHGDALARMPRRTMAELIFTRQDVPREAHREPLP